MTQITIARDFSVSAQEAKERVRLFLQRMQQDEGINSTWEGDHCRIAGTGIQGEVRLGAQRVDIDIELSLLMRPFRSIVEKTIEEGLVEAFTMESADNETNFEDIAAEPSAAPAGNEGIRQWIAAYEHGYSLPREFYTHNDVFETDVRYVFQHLWLYAGHVSQIPETGCYFLFDVAGDSIIILRDQDGDVRAFHNVCRHRGSHICTNPTGKTRTLVCPYHAWSYDLNGSLKGARAMPADFDPAANGLMACHVQLVHGMIFINLKRDGVPPDFSRASSMLDEYLGPHGFGDARVAHIDRTVVRANWKLVSENFLECYHCVPTHPQYCKVNAHAAGNSLGKQRDIEAYQKLTAHWEEGVRAKNGIVGMSDHVTRVLTEQPIVCYRQPIREGFETLSEDGKPIAPLMGNFREFDGGETVVALGPIHFVSAAADHATLFRFTPLAPEKTEVTVTWLVDGGAEAGRDYDLDRLTWMWRHTIEQDTRITEDNHAGVRSRYYRPGRYSLLELPVQRFISAYLQMISRS